MGPAARAGSAGSPAPSGPGSGNGHIAAGALLCAFLAVMGAHSLSGGAVMDSIFTGTGEAAEEVAASREQVPGATTAAAGMEALLAQMREEIKAKGQGAFATPGAGVASGEVEDDEDDDEEGNPFLPDLLPEVPLTVRMDVPTQHDGVAGGGDSTCADRHHHCRLWASQGECDKNPAWMATSCPKSCNACAGGVQGGAAAVGRAGASGAAPAAEGGCADRHGGSCASWAARGECDQNPRFMLSECAKSCEACEGGRRHHGMLRKTGVPTAAETSVSGAAEAEDPDCLDDKEECTHWASIGECDKNPQYMRASCPVSCGTCEDMRTACDRVNGSGAIVQEPGGLNALFERAISSFPELSPTVLSRTPWVVQFENFLEEEEAAAFLRHCEGQFARSLAGDQVSPVRTSDQCWCSAAACVDDPVIRRVTARVGAVTGVPYNNTEFAQVVRYSPGQFYKVHHDQNCAPWTPQGPRLLTLFMYANDVEEGGGTRFTDLDVTVQPRRGRAVLWPSVLDANLTREEPRTHHEALPPTSEVKIGINFWLHQYDFRTPSGKGCRWTSRNTQGH